MSTRFLAWVIGLVALALTVTGIVLAATDPNPGGVAKDPLALNGYPPRSASLEIAVSTSSGESVLADVTVNFVTNRTSALVSFPDIVGASAVDVTMANNHLYARSADVTNGPWYETRYKTPSLFGASLELTKPDIDLITGFSSSVSRSGYSTTYTFTRRRVVLTKLLGSAKSLAKLGSVHWTITVGSQGEASASTLAITAKHEATMISAKVISYNQPANVALPPSKDMQAMSHSAFEKLLHSGAFASILIPRELTSSAQTSLS